MATAAITTDLSTNLITNCDSTGDDGDWSGVGPGTGVLDPVPLEGTARLDFIIKSTTDTSNDTYFDPIASINLTSQHLRWPMYTALKATMKLFSENAVDISLL